MQTQIRIKWKYKYSHVAVIGRRASHGKMIHNDHHPHALVSHQISPETVWKNTKKNILLAQIWGRSISAHISLPSKARMSMNSPVFLHFFAHPPIFLPFLWPAACIVPSSKPISNNAPKMVATGPHTAIIWLKATLFIIGCTVGLTMCQTGVTRQR